MFEYLKKYYSEDNGCDCGGDCHCEESNNIEEEDPMIEIVDPDTGETFTFYFADEFEHEDKQYCVLVTDDEENPEYVIGRMVEDEDGESYIETLGEEEDDAVYDAYEEILAESFDNEEEDEED